MKRWQARGEVEDSEDDELSLDESPSPEPPRKRQKQNEKDASRDSQNADSTESRAQDDSREEADTETWLRPKLAKTYGRKANLPKQTSPATGSTAPLAGASINSSTVDRALPLRASSPSDEKPPQDATPLLEKPPPNLINSVENGPRDSSHVISSAPNQPTEDLLASIQERPPAPSDFEDSSQQLFNLGERQPLSPPTALSSPLSSAPSEREVSPIVEIRRQQPLPEPLRPDETGLLDEDVGSGNVSPALPEDIDQFPSTAHARRNLRNRKPEQLNPYQVERMRYLAQCRARGVKPVKFVEQEVSNQEAQDVSQSSQDQDQSGSYDVHSSSPQYEDTQGPDMPLRRPHTTLDVSDEDLRGTSRPAKRIKLSKLAKRTQSNRPQESLDDFTVPPSPPRTSSSSGTSDGSDMMALPDARRTASGFIMPLGFTPAPLPTPQISSEARAIGRSSSIRSNMSSRSPRRSSWRRSPATVSSSSEEDESEVESQNLRREQKRIRGVLPASWLRLDLQARAQKRPQSPPRHASTTDSPGKEPPKGVARQVKRAGGASGSVADLPFWSGDDSDSANSARARTPLERHRPSQRSTVPFMASMGDAQADDLMENDFVDPMLAGGSSRPARRKRDARRQPRITEAFSKTSARTEDFSEERLQYRAQAASNGTKSKKTKSARVPRRPYVRLSIADHATSPTSAASELPSFMKLALRRARNTKDYGRHSPGHKLVRLATADDTAEASAVLRAWRSGNIAPRSSRETSMPSSAHDERIRHPFAELSNNAQQRRFPAPVRQPKPSSGVRLPQSNTRKRQTHFQPAQKNSSTGDSGPAPVRAERERRPERIPQRPELQQRLRGAQLETLERDFDDSHREAIFERRMQCLTESVALPVRRGRASGVQLDRYLHDLDAGHDGLGQQQIPDQDDAMHQEEVALQQPLRLPHRPRKVTAKRLEVGDQEFRQPVTFADVEHDEEQSGQEPEISSGPVLQGLGYFGTKYPLDFDIQPLPADSHFHNSTFIGSGDFHQALQLSRRNLDRLNGHVRVYLNESTLEWSAWTEEVATQFSLIAKTIKEALQTPQTITDEQQQNVDRNVDYFLRSAVRYCSSCLYFLDPVDRRTCVQRLEALVIELSELLTETSSGHNQLRNAAIRIRQYQLVLVKQAQQLCGHAAVPRDSGSRIDDLLLSIARSLAKEAIVGHFDELCFTYENIRGTLTQDMATKDNMWALSSIVLLNHVFGDDSGRFWQAIELTSGLDIGTTCSVPDMEKIWRSLFLLLPALEIDSEGIARAEAGMSRTQEGWDVVRPLVIRTLDLYDSSSRIRGFTVNDYVRSLFSRAHYLVNERGWWRCGPLLGVIYDFFARRNLGLLRNEEGQGSPRFLEELSGKPSFEILPDDRSFHIFLKLVASALVGMRTHHIYSDSKITGIAWRLLPNHSRTCRKDVDLQRSELEALRNHYDLLCTLYYAMPPGRRISIDTPRSLVDQSTSHREACKLCVKAWTHMTSFQMSTQESVKNLEPLSAWYTEMLRVNMAHFRLAKTEAERNKQEAEKDGVFVGNALVESTIAQNQTEVAKVIVDALAGLKRAIASASSRDLAATLIKDTQFWSVFDLFDPGQHRILSIMLEALRVVETALDVDDRLMLPAATQDSSDDSQDFGDSSVLQELVAAESSVLTRAEICNILVSPVTQFLSNVFGADISADDSLLEDLVGTWSRLAAITVRTRQSTWSNYVDEYSTTSWSQMRDTAQKRKYATYFMAKVVEQSKADTEVVQPAIPAWLLSLVEREAMLKFQHTLTSTLLNNCPDEPLLHNLPFARDQRSGRFDISLHELRQRRVSLIDSVLFNMRAEYDDTLLLRPSRKDEIQSTYRSMLRQLMQAMKTNYRDLQGNADVADASVQGSYVEFVQQVVSALQQHVSGLCQVDRFFTDSTAFPLPATDPTYVVGRLRSYIPRLRESRTRTQLAVFIQTVSERAATDGQQHYLTRQLIAAMKDVRERGNHDSPTLRHVLLTSIVPAYVDNSLSRPCAWILALPMLEACEQIMGDLVYGVQIESENSVRAATEIISSMLQSLLKQSEFLSTDPGHLFLPHVLMTLSKSTNVVRSTLTIVSSIRRLTAHGAGLGKQLGLLYARFRTLQSILEGLEDISYMDDGEQVPVHSAWPDTRQQADKQIREALAANWSESNGHYWIRRGNTTKEVVVELSDVDEERAGLLEAITEFCEAYDATHSPRQRNFRASRRDDALAGLVI